MPAQKTNFYDIVARPSTVRSQSGYVSEVNSAVWELRGSQIDYRLLTDVVTERFLEEIKHHLATVTNAQSHADATIRAFFNALKDCVHFSFRGTGEKVNTLTNAIIEGWRKDASGATYPYFLRLFLNAIRSRDPGAFPSVTDKVLNALRKPDSEIEHILSLDPKQGPWLEREVLDQDIAIEAAYTNGAWHVERYVLVQLFRLYGMRPDQIANMKISDVRCRATGHTRGEIRWPYAKNDLAADQAPWWPLGGALLPAMETYLTLCLDGIPPNEKDKLPLFTPTGPSGCRKRGKRPEPTREPGYEGHVLASLLSRRFVYYMQSLGLETSRSGQPEPMHFNPRRERHTVGTRLALKGYSAQMIALRLSHKSSQSCTSYVDLARMAMQMRNPKFFHLMDNVGSVFTNPVVSRAEIEESLTPIISVEATTATEITLVGGGSCGNCMFAGDASTGEPWPCLSCSRFQLYEDADLQPLWDILLERKAYMHHQDGTWNNRFDPDIRTQFDRYEALLIGAERRRREVAAERTAIMRGRDR